MANRLTSNHIAIPDIAEQPEPYARRLPIGAEIKAEGEVEFRVWAPAAERVEVVMNGRRFELTGEHGGYFSGTCSGKAGDRYQFSLDGGTQLLPDPASRFQPDGPHGPSEIVDPSPFIWQDAAWPGVKLEGQILYELHVGTFTAEGTWTAAERELPELARLGITVIELMPIAEFDGRFGWGYDGVDLYAPFHHYGPPDDLRRFVNRAHELGLGVILDVVYNHLGPRGNYLRAFSPSYFSDRYNNEWGDAINFDGDDAGPVREFVVSNAGYWIDEFHMDGFRLDATQQIFDRSAENIMAAIGRRARESAGKRSILLVAENEPQDSRLIRPLRDGGYGLDGLWNDDFHHSAKVALTGRSEAYYTDTRGEPQEFISAAKYGYLFQGQYYSWQRQPRGTQSRDFSPAHWIIYLDNHDQVANSAGGWRGHQITTPSKWRAMTAFLLLAPSTPMLFQGQEFSASTPFLYFADFDGDLAAAIRKGRAEFLSQFPSLIDYMARHSLDDPCNQATFEACRLNVRERSRHASVYALHRDLIRLRRNTAAFSRQGPHGVDGAVLSAETFVIRFMAGEAEDDRLLLINLGPDLNRASFAEPLLAPPPDHTWGVEWNSEDPRYEGGGLPDSRFDAGWHIPAESALVLLPVRKAHSA